LMVSFSFRHCPGLVILRHRGANRLRKKEKRTARLGAVPGVARPKTVKIRFS
jgi:hypothetical protein